eukprot:GHUV01049886.1.p1 GENE.GHUV01049886.1~~GHUV01049886.1.p1  ORF type:complete len:185 (+),score=44.77 GHUV01049886.1:345-899(+)
MSCCCCSILYTRGIYPDDTFQTKKHYDMSLWMTKDEKLARYLNQVTQQMQDWLEQGLLQRLVLVVNSAVGQKEVVERWTFQVETDKAVMEGGPLPEKPKELIQKEIAGIIRQILGSVSFLPLLEDPCTFDLLVYTDKDSDVPVDWEESDPRFITGEQEELTMRSVSTKVHTVEAGVAYKVKDAE